MFQIKILIQKTMVRPNKETPLSVAERVKRYAEKKKGEDPESWLEIGQQKKEDLLREDEHRAKGGFQEKG